MLLAAIKRNKEARSHNFFDTDIASSFDLGSVAAASPSPNPYVISGRMRIGISFSVSTTEGQLTLDSNGREYTAPSLEADETHRLDIFPIGREIIPTCAIAGTVRIFVFDQWMNSQEIANGIFT